MPIQNAIGNALRTGVQFILGSDSPGDIYFRSTPGPLARLGIGTIGQVLTVNQQGFPTWANYTNWAVITANQSAAINSSYITNSTNLITLALPATAPVGSVLEVTGIGTGGWRIGQAAGQQVFFGSVSSTSGAAGQLNSTQSRDAIRLVCVTADTTWQVISSIGNIDVI